MALHYGDYEYGRISGIRSTAAAFDGASVIEVARLEQGLGAAMRSGQTVLDPAGPTVAVKGKGNYVVQSGALRRRLGGRWRPEVPGCRYLGQLDLSAKEFRDRADLLEVSASGHRESG